MHRVTWNRRAVSDIRSIAQRIAESQPAAAHRFLDEIIRSIDLIRDQPAIGSPWPSRRKHLSGIRRWPIHGFTKVGIFYREEAGQIHIIRVLHGAQRIGESKLMDD